MTGLARSLWYSLPVPWLAIALLVLAAPSVPGCAPSDHQRLPEEGAPPTGPALAVKEADSTDSQPAQVDAGASMEVGLAERAVGSGHKETENSEQTNGVQTRGGAVGGNAVASPHPVSKGDFDRVLSALRGNVVLVDCWGTWCIPCRKLLLHTAQLSRRHAGAGLSVITLAFDEPESMAEVIAVLNEAGISGRHLIVQGGAVEESFEAFEIPGGILPHYKIYDRVGRLRTSLSPQDAPVTAEAIDRAVAEALAQETHP